MTNDLPAAPAAPELHPRSLAHALGDPVGIALLDDPGVWARAPSSKRHERRWSGSTAASRSRIGASTGSSPATTAQPLARFLTTATQMPEEKAYSPHHATHSHCSSADQLITLAALEADGRLTHGGRVPLLASSPFMVLTALERVGPAPA